MASTISKADEYRSGIGYDVHAFVRGRKLILGGVQIPYERGLKGHSDADVLIHAVMDALLGAAGEGDIGEHFPDTERKYKGASSVRLLEKVRSVIGKKGFSVVNVDVTLLMEEPKVSPFKARMKANIARVLRVERSR
ncbi:MAG: 2-C-methyl-D-erythritol 2,4-cyclodiphosphate synthase, partial [Elusimicrobia bacterium]|nr:2-C-methyl-D-erythritol 2,4-cyclodiphosphate synthase [Elusimicrobiota bacterium]